MWQPIETAPKDGREILVYDGARCDIVGWTTTAGGWSGWQCVAQDEWASQSEIALRVESPTHWMPLPEPPK